MTARSGADDTAAAYLRRLAVAHRPPPTLASLQDLLTRHLETVPFENLDIVVGTTQALSTANVLHKVVSEGRGGFCYELNEAFRWLLDDLGFVVRRIQARVWQRDAERFGPPFDHLALVVSLPDGDYLVDVGYGDGCRVPLRFAHEPLGNLPGEHFLRPVPGGYWRLASQSQILYDMTTSAQSLAAFAQMYRYHQTSSESLFARGLLCTRATPSGRITLSGSRLIVVTGGQRTESAVPDVAAALRTHFATHYPPMERLIPC